MSTPGPSVIAELSGSASSVELTERALERLQTVVAVHHGLATTLSERALRDAVRADREGSSGPLKGIPFAVKDAFAAAGAPTTWGSKYFADQAFARDARVIRQLASAGAVLTGKLAMSELAGYGGPTASGASLHGTPANPWRASCYAGGSSGGSAIAVATGAVPFALGTETGGSVVGPAALCGITGFRPTLGRISREGMLTLSPTLDKAGILARTACDCANVFAVVGARATGRPQSGGATPRIGMFADEPDDWNDEIHAALSTAIGQFAELGECVTLSREVLGAPIGSLHTIMLSEAAFALREQLSDPEFHLIDPAQEAGLRAGCRIVAHEYLAALDARRALLRRFAGAFARCDVIVAATRADTARPLGAPVRAGGKSVADLLRAAANLAGLPGVSVPAGLSTAGLPVGLHVVGHRGCDELVLQIAGQYQARTSHHLLQPPGVAA